MFRMKQTNKKQHHAPAKNSNPTDEILAFENAAHSLMKGLATQVTFDIGGRQASMSKVIEAHSRREMFTLSTHGLFITYSRAKLMEVLKSLR